MSVPVAGMMIMPLAVKVAGAGTLLLLMPREKATTPKHAAGIAAAVRAEAGMVRVCRDAVGAATV